MYSPKVNSNACVFSCRPTTNNKNNAFTSIERYHIIKKMYSTLCRPSPRHTRMPSWPSPMLTAVVCDFRSIFFSFVLKLLHHEKCLILFRMIQSLSLSFFPEEEGRRAATACFFFLSFTFHLSLLSTQNFDTYM